MYPRNVGIYQNYTASHPRIFTVTKWESRISETPPFIDFFLYHHNTKKKYHFRTKLISMTSPAHDIPLRALSANVTAICMLFMSRKSSLECMDCLATVGSNPSQLLHRTEWRAGPAKINTWNCRAGNTAARTPPNLTTPSHSRYPQSIKREPINVYVVIIIINV